jgi:hypothetical protein
MKARAELQGEHGHERWLFDGQDRDKSCTWPTAKAAAECAYTERYKYHDFATAAVCDAYVELLCKGTTEQAIKYLRRLRAAERARRLRLHGVPMGGLRQKGE